MYRYTFHFVMGSQGWSETLFRAAPFGSGEGSYLENYINNRLTCLSTQCAMVSIRASNLDSARDVIIYTLPTSGRGGVWAIDPSEANPGGLTVPEDNFTALSVRLSDGAQHYRSFAMLGMPDYVFSGNAIVPSIEAMVRGRLNNWVTSMSLAGFGMKIQTAPTKSGRITEFYPKTADNRLICLGLTGTVPSTGDLITLGSVKPFNKLNRTWRVAGVTTGDENNDCFIYLASTTELDTYGAVQGGKYKVQAFTLAVINSYTISRMTSRKTGVPFDTVRGRRSGRSI